MPQLRKRAENGETNLDAVARAQVHKAIKGDTRAAEFVRDSVDGRPSAGDGDRTNIGRSTFNGMDRFLHGHGWLNLYRQHQSRVQLMWPQYSGLNHRVRTATAKAVTGAKAL